MASWSVADIKTEIENVDLLLKARQAASPCGVQEDRSAMATSMVNSLCHKIKSFGTTLNATNGMFLYEVIGTLHMDDRLKAQLTSALDACFTGDSFQSSTCVTQKPQSLIHIYNYLTAKDWEVLDKADVSSAGGVWEVINVIVNCFRRLNLRSIKEDTKKWTSAFVVNLILDKNGRLPPYRMIYTLGQDLCQAHATNPVRATNEQPCPAMYPATPAELGPEFMKKAYDPEDPPVSRCMPKLAQLAQYYIPVRTTSKLLKDAIAEQKLTPAAPAAADSNPLAPLL